MKNIVLISVLLLIFASDCQAQTEKINSSDNVKKHAQQMGNFLIAKNYKEYIKFTYPAILEMLGGYDKGLGYITNAFKETEKEGVELKKITFENPSEFIKTETELQCTLSAVFEYNSPVPIKPLKTTTIGISINNGENWYFVDTYGLMVVI